MSMKMASANPHARATLPMWCDDNTFFIIAPACARGARGGSSGATACMRTAGGTCGGAFAGGGGGALDAGTYPSGSARRTSDTADDFPAGRRSRESVSNPKSVNLKPLDIYRKRFQTLCLMDRFFLCSVSSQSQTALPREGWSASAPSATRTLVEREHCANSQAGRRGRCFAGRRGRRYGPSSKT